MTLRVTFVLPGAANVPTGGARMVLRYANALAAAGDHVTVMMAAGTKPGPWWRLAARRARHLGWKLTGGWSPRSWFDLDPRVRLLWVPELREPQAPAADAVVATAVQTAEIVAGWGERPGRKFYLVQGYETWDFPAERVQASWRLPLRKFAVSHWLCDLIAVAGSQAVFLPNGIDEVTFGLDVPPHQRPPGAILWPFSPQPFKGAADVLAAVAALRAAGRNLDVHAFGTVRPPAWPTPMAFHLRPKPAELRRLYNAAAIFVAPSHSEGWGLPACEALQCGCALAASDIGGHREFLRGSQNALLHSPGDVPALQRNLARLLDDGALRQRMGLQGVADMAAWRLEPQVACLRRWLGGEESA